MREWVSENEISPASDESPTSPPNITIHNEFRTRTRGQAATSNSAGFTNLNSTSHALAPFVLSFMCLCLSKCNLISTLDKLNQSILILLHMVLWFESKLVRHRAQSIAIGTEAKSLWVTQWQSDLITFPLVLFLSVLSLSLSLSLAIFFLSRVLVVARSSLWPSRRINGFNCHTFFSMNECMNEHILHCIQTRPYWH